MGKNMSIMDAPGPSDIHINKLILIINNTLNYNQIPTFTIIVIGVVICRSCDRHVESIDGSCAPWKSPCSLKTLHNLPKGPSTLAK